MKLTPASLVLSQMQGLEARSWIEMSVLSKYFFYQLWNILFVLVSSTVWQNVKTPRDVVEIIGDSLPVFSPTLINYTMLQAFASYPAQLLLVGPLLLTWITRMTQFRSTPRLDSDIYYPSVLTSMNYGYSYPVPILIWVIGMIYAPIAPIVSAFCCFFFGVAYMVNKYMLLYVHIPQYETGGMQTPMAVRRCLIGMLIMQATMMCVLAMKYATPIASPLSLSSSSSAIIMLVTKFKDDVAAAQWTGYVSMIVNAMVRIGRDVNLIIQGNTNSNAYSLLSHYFS